MITSIEDFIKYIPTARGTHFEDIEVFIQEGLLWPQTEIFGSDLVKSVEASEDSDLNRIFNSIIALKAYSSAIPFLDVVQTSNGFAVVNNANVVPASRERVDKLLQWVNERLYFHVDSLIEYVSANATLLAEWRKFHKYNFLTELVFWNGNEFMQYCGDYEKMETIVTKASVSYKGGSAMAQDAARRRIPYLELRRLHGVIRGFQDEEISNFISKDYLNELIDKNRQKTLLANEASIFNRLRFIVGLFLQNEDAKAKEQLKAIVNMMMLSLETYTTFANSEEYKVKVAVRYQNLEEDPTYFFM